MAKLKLSALEDDKPVKLTVELPAGASADARGRDRGRAAADPARRVAPMLARFMATDREFTRRRRSSSPFGRGSEQG